MNKIMIASLALCAVSLISCMDRKNISPIPSVSEDARTSLERPINCRTAKQDIATLEDERASLGKQIASGVRSVFPIAAVAGLLTGDYSDRVQVATGQYNSDIDAKIDQIKATCRAR